MARTMQYLWTAAALVIMANSIRAEPRQPNVLWICADDHALYVCDVHSVLEFCLQPRDVKPPPKK